MHISTEITVVCLVFQRNPSRPATVFRRRTFGHFSVLQCSHVRGVEKIGPQARRPSSCIAIHTVQLQIGHRIAFEMACSVFSIGRGRGILRAQPVLDQCAHADTGIDPPKSTLGKGRFGHVDLRNPGFIEIILQTERRQHRVQPFVRSVSRPVAHMSERQITAQTPMLVQSPRRVKRSSKMNEPMSAREFIIYIVFFRIRPGAKRQTLLQSIAHLPFPRAQQRAAERSHQRKDRTRRGTVVHRHGHAPIGRRRFAHFHSGIVHHL